MAGGANRLSRSSTRGCGSSWPRAGCRTGPGSSPRRSSRSPLPGLAPRGCALRGMPGGRRRREQLSNWQWVAGTGADTRPNRVLNPTRQARRFDPDGAYVRRWVPELEGIDGASAHEPWRLGLLAPSKYPAPIVDHEAAVRRFLDARRPSSSPAAPGGRRRRRAAARSGRGRGCLPRSRLSVSGDRR